MVVRLRTAALRGPDDRTGCRLPPPRGGGGDPGSGRAQVDIALATIDIAAVRTIRRARVRRHTLAVALLAAVGVRLA